MKTKDSFKLLRKELKKAYCKNNISKDLYLEILFSLNKNSKEEINKYEKITFIMPDRKNPLSDLEQKMMELNIVLIEKYGNVEEVSKIIENVFNKIPEKSEEKIEFFNIVNHFKYLSFLLEGNPNLLTLIEERNSYKIS